MILLPHRLTARCAALGAAISLIACTPGFNDTISTSALKGANEGAAFIKISYGKWPCDGNVGLAKETSPGKFELHSTPRLVGINSRQLSLPAGTYHVGYIQCLTSSSQAVVVGETDGTLLIGNPHQSLARFTIVPGQVVNLGVLNIVPTDHLANSARLSIADIDEFTMDRLRKAVPTLSSTLVSRLMALTSPGEVYKLRWEKVGLG
jgi:hypothetical protein